MQYRKVPSIPTQTAYILFSVHVINLSVNVKLVIYNYAEQQRYIFYSNTPNILIDSLIGENAILNTVIYRNSITSISPTFCYLSCSIL